MQTLPKQASPDPTAEQADSDEVDGPDEELPGLLDPVPVWEGGDDEQEPEDELLDLDLQRGFEDPASPEDSADSLDVGGDAAELALLPDESRHDFSVGSDEEELGAGELGNDWLTEDSGGSALDDETEGLEESDLVNPELPELQPEDDTELPVAGELPLATAFADEAKPRPAAVPWVQLESGSQLEACSALTTADGVVIAASSDLLWFSFGELGPLRLEAGSSPVHAVALLGSGWDLAICATENGRLLRRGRLASASEVLRGVREAGDSAARQTLDLCQPGAGFPHALLVRTHQGRLFRSDDDGTTFRPLNTARVVAVAPRGALALAAGTLMQSHDAGGSFEERPLSGLARDVSTSAAPLIAGCKAVIALGEASLGILVSSDAGQSFQRIAGTTHVSALSVGEQAGEMCVFAALYDGARDRSSLLRVVVATRRAEEIASISAGPDSGDAGEDSEEAHVAQLVWDSVHQRLWVAGGFGIRVFEPRTAQ